MRIVKSVSVLAVILGCVLVAPAAFADPGDSLALESVRAQQAQIRAGIQSGSGIYANVSAMDRGVFLDRQARMLRMIDGKQMSGELSELEKTELFNTLEWIEATVNRTQDEQMVCERRTVLGSNMMKRVCMTVAEKREATERARQELTRSSPQLVR